MWKVNLMTDEEVKSLYEKNLKQMTEDKHIMPEWSACCAVSYKYKNKIVLDIGELFDTVKTISKIVGVYKKIFEV